MISDAEREIQYPNLRLQAEAYISGMWVFLASEVLFFGTLFVGYTVMRVWYVKGFVAGSSHLHLWIGASNTAILFASSFTMSLALHAIQQGRPRLLAALLVLTALLGMAFDSLKGLEYVLTAHEGLFPGPGFTYTGPAPVHQVEMFFFLYFVMTGLHAVHLILGVGVLLALAIQAWRGRFTATDHLPVFLAEMYWNFVDLVWIFLFPLFYLVTR